MGDAPDRLQVGDGGGSIRKAGASGSRLPGQLPEDVHLDDIRQALCTIGRLGEVATWDSEPDT